MQTTKPFFKILKIIELIMQNNESFEKQQWILINAKERQSGDE